MKQDDIQFIQSALALTPGNKLKARALINDLHFTTLSRAPVLTAGTLAYVDHLQGGLVPCKVFQVSEAERQDGARCYYVQAIITANRFGFTKGRVHTSEDAGRIVPRKAIKRHANRFIVLPFNIVVGP